MTERLLKTWECHVHGHPCCICYSIIQPESCPVRMFAGMAKWVLSEADAKLTQHTWKPTHQPSDITILRFEYISLNLKTFKDPPAHTGYEAMSQAPFKILPGHQCAECPCLNCQHVHKPIYYKPCSYCSTDSYGYPGFVPIVKVKGRFHFGKAPDAVGRW